MYTLVLLVIAHSLSGEVSTALTQFRTPNQESCEKTRKLLEADNAPNLQVKAYCVP